jgi:hypothetical protein
VDLVGSNGDIWRFKWGYMKVQMGVYGGSNGGIWRCLVIPLYIPELSS